MIATYNFTKKSHLGIPGESKKNDIVFSLTAISAKDISFSSFLLVVSVRHRILLLLDTSFLVVGS
jgi:hypothetical protein